MKQEPAESALVETKPGFVGILALFLLRAGRMFYRGGSQEKTLPPPLEFLLLPAPRA